MLAAIERETVHELHSWKLYPGLGASLTSLARGLARSQLQHHVRAQIEDSLYDLLMDYTGITQAIASMFARRHTCFQNTIASSKNTKKAAAAESKAAAASLKSGGTDPAHSKYLTAKKALQDANTAEQDTQDKITEVSQTAKEEVPPPPASSTLHAHHRTALSGPGVCVCVCVYWRCPTAARPCTPTSVRLFHQHRAGGVATSEHLLGEHTADMCCAASRCYCVGIALLQRLVG